MESSVPPQMIDDYDAFDWAEAVKVLDAYETTNRSSSSATTTSTATPFQNCNSHTVSCPKIENKKPTSSRQSTLDRFIGLTGVKSTIREAKCDALDDAFCNDETISGVSIDPEAAKTWIYPESPPVRDYQVSITKTALFSNTLVSLPTGLGKTLIAAVVMYNYYRWFPKGKIVFTAPSRPLVTQQIEACHNIVGIPQELEVDLTGQTNPTKRVSLWKDKQIFFVTPQILEKDIKSGSCPVNELVCLVFDEAHHASGNYPYCVVVRELMSMAINLRILALTATPGGDHQTVQQVIDNLQISSLEYRSESDHDVISYVHAREVEVIQVEMGKEAVEVNKLLMDVIRVYVRKLSVTGLLPNRDPQTLSSLDILNIKEKFHQFPPQGLDQSQYGEVDAIISVLITLYYIRKWLSAHGIRSALKMLEDKLKQGYFASLLSRNENIHKAKVLMEHNLSHGSLSPKFSKLLQVLVEHFKKHDPQKSRVIIFSHYRESVSDIMSSLATIGEHVKAMEFVGQNSGKTSKGQSQKVQQAVLQKFRDGGYNVIVATSIGEEGLDIMEVDLVICFDANISPLRMIQRMGRTGRKTKGRVVVLACGGIELNGYKSKQAKGKAVSKHMRNAGKSFLFHPSPRMVPHVFKPEQKVVKFTIEEYVPRGKKVKVDDAIQIPKYKLKLTDAENHLIQKYFQPAATEEDKWRPSLIAFPHFQAFPSRVHGIAHSMRTSVLIDTMQYLQGLSFNGLDEEASEECFKGETVDLDHHSSNTREDDVAGKEAETDTSSFMDVSKTEETRHSFLFESGFTTVDSNGNISILCVPGFPLKPFSPIKNSMQQNTLFLNRPKFDVHSLNEDHPEIALDVHSLNDMPEEDELDDGMFQGEICSSEVLARVNDTVIPDFHSDEDGDLSPRLINLLISGVVPESPVNTCTPNKATDVDNTSISFVQSTPDKETGIPEISLLNNAIDIDKGASASKFVGEIKTPQTNLSTKSCSKDWILSSGEKSVSQPKKKLKRLRRVCDIKNGKEEIVSHSSVPVSRSYAPSDHAYDKYGRGGRKLLNDARIFIDDEAEASSEEACDDDDEEGEDCYGGSFIDDRINLTVAATQAETTQIDMMAIYRRSLLTQSPIVDFSPDNAVSADDVATNPSPHTNGHSSSSSLISLTSSGHLSTKRLSSEPVSTPTDGPANETKRRKSNFSQGGCGPLPVCNLEKEIFLKPEEAAAAATGGRETTWQTDEVDVDVDDDEFFQGIDLDALVEQASKQLKTKSNLSIEKPKNQDLDFLGSPSFDLGI